MGLRDAADLAHTLAAALAEGGTALDVATVQSVDSSILQLLIAGHRTACETDTSFGFVDPEQPVLRAALIGHGIVAGDGSALTPEHDFWTRPITSGPITPGPITLSESEAA